MNNLVVNYPFINPDNKKLFPIIHKKNFNFKYDENTKISDLKRVIFQKTGIPIEQQSVRWPGNSQFMDHNKISRLHAKQVDIYIRVNDYSISNYCSCVYGKYNPQTSQCNSEPIQGYITISINNEKISLLVDQNTSVADLKKQFSEAVGISPERCTFSVWWNVFLLPPESDDEKVFTHCKPSQELIFYF